MINSCLSTLYNYYAGFKNIPDRYCRKILRLCVFQHAENAGQFERSLIRIYKFFSQGICSTGYDTKRAQTGRDILEKLGAKFLTIPVEGHLIDAMHWHPETLKRKIEALGGNWRRHILSNGEEVLAIQSPAIPSKDWIALEQNLLYLNWPKKEGLIITCASADIVNDDKNLFIQLNSASTSYIMMRKKISFFLGCKQAVVVFDPPGTGLSTGIATEGSYYRTIKVIFEKFADDYPPNRVWVCGTCLGCVSAAYIRSQIPDINLLLENGFVNLQQDMIKPEGRFVYWFAKRYWQALFNNEQDESGFDIAKLWNLLPQSSLGKIIIISIDNDQRLSTRVSLNLVELARRINATVSHIHYHSPKKDAHFSRFDDMPHVPKQVLECIFK